jgi:UDP-2,3-diacylglucosamine pyrophosphatase LpxH
MSDPHPDRMPVEQREHDIVIVSDLHLANGYSRTTGRFDPREDFFYDGEFHRFTQYLVGQGRERDRPQRLIILGDVFEFLQVDNRPYRKDGLPEPSHPAYQDHEVQDFLHHGKAFNGLGTSQTATIWRLERIARGHAEWFRALGEFLQADPRHRLDIVIGNHDIEMTWPGAQQRFKELVAESVGGAAIQSAIYFYPWFIYEPGLFYAEHGQQYDSLNSFTTLLEPTLPPRRGADGTIDWERSDPIEERVIELPLGSFFVRYVFNFIEINDSFADNVRPFTRYIAWALYNKPVFGLKTLFYQTRLLTKVLRKSSELSEDEQLQRRERYHRSVLAAYASQASLPAAALVAIDQLATLPSMNSRWQQARQVVIDPLVPLLWILAPIVVMFRALRQVRGAMRALATFGAGLLGLLYRERAAFRPPSEPASGLRDAARKIDAILRETTGRGVRFYIFGHTHKAEVFPLGPDQDEPRYLNTGTWTPIIDPDAQLLRGTVQHNFVQILRHDNGYQLAELLYWNDGAGRPQLVPLVD